MQRWGSEQAPDGSVLLRTGALMSLATLGTAGLVLCGALAVGGPSGAGFAGAFGSGPASVTIDEDESPSVLAAPSVRRRPATSDLPRSPRPTSGRDQAVPAVVRAPGAARLSGTTSAAARTPTDLDSVGHSARAQVLGVSSTVAPALRSLAAGPTTAPVTGAPPAPTAAAGRPALRTAAPAATASARPAQAPRAAQARAGQRVTAAPAVRGPKAPHVARAAEAHRAPKAPHVARAAEAHRAPKAPKAPPVAKAHKAPKAPPVAKAHKAPKAPPVAKAPPVVQAPNAHQAPKAVKAVKAPKAAAQHHTAPPARPAPAEPAPAAAAPHVGEPAQHGKAEHPKGEPPGQAKGNGPKH